MAGIGSSVTIGAAPERHRPGPNVLIGPTSMRPTVGYDDELWYDTTTSQMYQGTGSGWALVSVLGGIQLADGSSAAPSLSFLSEAALGLWRQSAGVLGIAGLTRLLLGGVTASFPALKLNGADLQVRLADDSDFANLLLKTLTASGDVTCVNLLASAIVQGATALRVGTSGWAQSGGVRLANNVPVTARNQADSADVDMFKLDTNNRIVAGAELVLPADPTQQLGAVTRQYAEHTHCQGRLTLVSGDPIPSADQTAKSTIYFTPYMGTKVSLYTGTVWKTYTFAELSLALSGLTSGKNYDVFLYDNAGTLTLELSAAWTNDTTRADAISLQDGIYVKTSATTRRYLGTLRATAATTTEDSAANRLFWNFYNRVRRFGFKSDSTGHTYNSTTQRFWNNDSTQKATFVVGLPDVVWVAFGFQGDNNATTGAPFCGWGVDVTTIQNGITNQLNGTTFFSRNDANNFVSLAAGYHEVRAVEATLVGTSIVNFAFYELSLALVA